MTDFTSATDADGIATITWDVPGKSMNVLSLTGMAELDALIDAALADPAVRGVILTSGKKDFAGGMDLNVIAKMKESAGAEPARGLFDGIMRFHGLERKIELAGMDPKTKRGKPIVAALPGTARSAPGPSSAVVPPDHRRRQPEKARIGLPEILVGIFPGAGGTTRLVRKAMAASPFLLEGKLSDPKKAQAAGIIDEVVAPDQLLARARNGCWARPAPTLSSPGTPRATRRRALSSGGLHDLRRRLGHGHGQDDGRLPGSQGPLPLSAVYEGAQIALSACAQDRGALVLC